MTLGKDYGTLLFSGVSSAPTVPHRLACRVLLFTNCRLCKTLREGTRPCASLRVLEVGNDGMFGKRHIRFANANGA